MTLHAPAKIQLVLEQIRRCLDIKGREASPNVTAVAPWKVILVQSALFSPGDRRPRRGHRALLWMPQLPPGEIEERTRQ